MEPAFSMMPLWIRAMRPDLVGVGMGVRGGGGAVGGPAGVADADGAGGKVAGDLLLEIGELAGRLVHLEARAVDDRDAGGVVPAVFHPPQSVEEQRRRLPWSDVPDNSAHSPTPSVQLNSARQASISVSASAAVGASAMNRMIGSVPDGRKCTQRSAQESRSPSRSSTVASAKRFRSAW